MTRPEFTLRTVLRLMVVAVAFFGDAAFSCGAW
jgi:hypothetical protein